MSGVYNRECLTFGYTAARCVVQEGPNKKKHCFTMKLQGSLMTGTLFMMISLCCAHIGGNQISLQDIEPQAYCGRALSAALGLLCFGLPNNEKRTASNSVYNSIMTQYKDQDNQLGWPWIPHHRARTMSLPSRKKRYVVSECCDKPCSVTELMSYC